MAENIEPRIKSREEYQSMFYQWIDELRKEHVQNQKRFKEHEEQLRRLADTQARIAEVEAMTARILRGMNEKLDGHEDRLSAAGI